MDDLTKERLNRLNRQFYDQFADQFAGARSLGQPSFNKILSLIPDGARVLDIGCGHGRIAQLLEMHRTGVRYHGLDFSDRFVGLGNAHAANFENIVAKFEAVDIMSSDWTRGLDAASYDIVLLLAVIHHIPGQSQRMMLVGQVASLLAASGLAIVSTWQFLTNERMRRKIVPWDTLNIKEESLEPGDYLLDWKRGGVGYRYCHMVEPNQMQLYAQNAGLEVKDTFLADGKEGDLSLFALMGFPPG
ncbi:MAG: class I SAM-dependent methyltransferase [Chloroflexota bacterium]